MRGWPAALRRPGSSETALTDVGRDSILTEVGSQIRCPRWVLRDGPHGWGRPIILTEVGSQIRSPRSVATCSYSCEGVTLGRCNYDLAKNTHTHTHPHPHPHPHTHTHSVTDTHSHTHTHSLTHTHTHTHTLTNTHTQNTHTHTHKHTHTQHTHTPHHSTFVQVASMHARD